jgi:hypothetical protein
MEHGLFSTFSNHAVGGGASPTSTGITLLPWLSADTISRRTESLGLSSRRLPAPFADYSQQYIAFGNSLAHNAHKVEAGSDTVDI